MKAEKTQSRTLRRKPLSDCSNVVHNRISSSQSKPRKPSLSIKEADESSLKHDSSVGSYNVENPSVEPQPSTPPNRRSLAASGTVGRENSGIISTYSRKRNLEARKDKGKAVAPKMPVSCPPVVRVRNLGNKLNEEHGDAGQSKTSVASHPKSKKHFSLPQDFIDQQKAYFAEIDALELPEEFESDSDK
ncbi:uncharacterized protein LOC122638257 isoform X2 [Telopea speciosissima]|uniref:uncharacterized protein LOC122638257 isoform X2 n=1 Tax=Telopea speciosissima TaxID=54955 RepID=UPI001CC41F1F|nr:uncharacterized protein LOC122638257 isoform X2 [Telopea speciosissima]